MATPWRSLTASVLLVAVPCAASAADAASEPGSPRLVVTSGVNYGVDSSAAYGFRGWQVGAAYSVWRSRRAEARPQRTYLWVGFLWVPSLTKRNRSGVASHPGDWRTTYSTAYLLSIRGRLTGVVSAYVRPGYYQFNGILIPYPDGSLHYAAVRGHSWGIEEGVQLETTLTRELSLSLIIGARQHGRVSVRLAEPPSDQMQRGVFAWEHERTVFSIKSGYIGLELDTYWPWRSGGGNPRAIPPETSPASSEMP